jgi:hypothetical protein
MSARTLVVSVALVLATFVTPAAAQDPNAVFAGKIVMSTKKFPQSSKSADAYIAAIKKQAQDVFVEDESSGTWKIYFTGFFKSGLDDVEYVVKVYDVTTKGQQLLVSFDQYTDQRGEKSVSSNMTLDKKQVGVNKQCLITMESKGKVLASARFTIKGQGEHYTGKVDFSNDGDDENDSNKKK